MLQQLIEGIALKAVSKEQSNTLAAQSQDANFGKLYVNVEGYWVADPLTDGTEKGGMLLKNIYPNFS